jgi:guanylate kinase
VNSLRMGELFVVSAPSGAGKTTLCREVCKRLGGILYSVSCTTRPPRQGEREGEDYFFLSDEAFDRMVAEGQFLEWAKVYAYKYGTPRRWVEEALEAGHDVLMDLDVQGAKKIRSSSLPCHLIFVLPPSIEELRSRLVKRAKDSPQEVEMRLQWAKGELGQWREFDFILVNDDLERAVKALESIIVAQRLRKVRVEKWMETEVQRLLSAEP